MKMILQKIENQKVKMELINGVEWFYKMVPGDSKGCLMERIGFNDINKKFIVCATLPNPKNQNKPTRLFAAFNCVLDFIGHTKKIPKDRWYFFEYILADQIQKLYFDIDVDIEKLIKLRLITIPEDPNHCKEILDNFSTSLVSSLAGRIVTVFNERKYHLNIEKQILVFNSNSESKRSYHIIVDGYAVSNCEENYALAQQVLEPFPSYVLEEKLIDPSMWSSKQQFRLYQSQKPGSGRPKIFVDKWKFGDYLIEYKWPEISVPDEITRDAVRFTTLFQASCITNTESCIIIPIILTNNPKRNKFWGHHTHENEYDEEDTKELTSDKIIDAICERVDKKMFSIYRLERGKIIGPLITLSRRQELVGTEIYCTLCKRTHKSNNAFLRVSKDGIVYFHCHATEGISRQVVDVTDLLDLNKELQLCQKQSIMRQISGITAISIESKLIMNDINSHKPSTIQFNSASTNTLHSQIKMIAAESHK
jgi:hypothetical protein